MSHAKSLRTIAAAGLILIFSVAGLHAQQKSERDAVLAANHDFDQALSSRDIAAMSKAWTHEPHVIVVHPVSKATSIGWEAVKKSWEEVFDLWADLSVSMKDPQVRIVQNVAWVVGVETAQGKLKNGNTVNFTAFTTNVFEKREGRWSMVVHTASRVPQ